MGVGEGHHLCPGLSYSARQPFPSLVSWCKAQGLDAFLYLVFLSLPLPLTGSPGGSLMKFAFTSSAQGQLEDLMRSPFYSVCADPDPTQGPQVSFKT